MAQPSGAQRVPVVEAEAPAAPPRGKLVLRLQQTQEGAAALLGLAARAPAAAPAADAMEGLPPYEGNDDCTVVTTESGRKPKRPHRKRASGRARARAPAVPVPAAPAAWLHFLGCGVCGFATAFVCMRASQYYTDYAYEPVRRIAESALTGHATVIITGLAVGLESVVAPALTVAVAVVASYHLGATSGLAAPR